MKLSILCILSSLLVATVCPAQTNAVRTDLTREVFVEYSQTDYQLGVTNRPAGNQAAKVFSLTAETRQGPCTLVCFIDGKFWKTQPFALPGEYSLSLRGLAVGEHRITLQTIDDEGRIGAATQTVSTRK